MANASPLLFAAPLGIFPLDDNLVIFHAPSARYWALNALARRLFEDLSHGASPEAAGGNLVAAYALGFDDAARIVAGTLRAWRDSGLIQDPKVPGGSDTADIPAQTPPPPDLDQAPADIAYTDYAFEDAGFRLGIDDPLLSPAHHPLFAGYRLSPSAALPADAPRFSVTREGEAYVLRRDGRVLDHTENLDAISTRLTMALSALVLGIEDFAAVFHGAAVVAGDSAYLFAGTTGAGKSTLAAALSCSGFACLNDDMVFARSGDERLFALPLRIKLRQPSWPLIAPLHPGLADLPETALGPARLKFLPAPGLPLARLRQGFSLKALFFPKVDAEADPEAPTELLRLSAAEAFARLIEGATWLAPEPESMARMLGLVERTPAFELRYADLSRVAALLAREVVP